VRTQHRGEGRTRAGAPDSPPRTTERFPCLDGYRALAALAVVLFHVLSYARLRGSTALDDVWLRLGNYGVTIFFLLSGFLLWRPYVVAHFDGRPSRPTGAYLRARVLRIAPAYWVALAALILGFRFVEAGSIGDTAAYVGLVQIYRADTVLGGLGVAWTLCIEISFYLMIPGLARAVKRYDRSRAPTLGARMRAQLGVVASLYLIAVIWRLVMVLGSPDLGPTLHWLPAYLDWFALGMLAAVTHSWVARGGGLPRWANDLVDAPWLCWALAAGVYGVCTQLGLPPGFAAATGAQTMGRFLLNGTSALLLLLPGVLGDPNKGGIRKTLRSRGLTWLGSISFGIYLWHTIWLRQVERWVAAGQYPDGAVAMLAAVMALTVGTAMISFETIEKPAMRLRRWPRGRAPHPVPGDADLAAAP